MTGIRVLVANEPRSYRESFVEALRMLRPEAEISEVQPDDLDQRIEDLKPDLIICSRLTLAVERTPAWLLVYPEGRPVTMVYTAGKLSSFIDLDLDKILSVVDRTAELVNSERRLARGRTTGLRDPEA